MKFCKIVLAVLLVFQATGSALAWQEPAFTLDQVMSAPFPSNLTISPAADKVAWVQNAKGVRNIWVAAAPEFTGRQLTGFDADDGQGISGLGWAVDGTAMYFVRGGAPNRQGETPNPAFLPDGASRRIWRVTLATGAIEDVAAGSSPTLSPSGERLVWLSRGRIFISKTDSVAHGRQLFSVRGSCSQLRWSPDGSKLAFVSRRGDHSFVGIFRFSDAKVTFLQPSLDLDSEPVWSPDGARVAFLRRPARYGFPLFQPHRTGLPWSIWIADAATGAAEEVWRADEGLGSVFRRIVAANQLFWTGSDHLVFPWEKNGWTQLFALKPGARSAEVLTPAESEVEYASLAAGGSTIYYNANTGDIDRRDLWRVTPGDGSAHQVTRGDEIEWSPVASRDGKVLAYVRSGAQAPAEAMIRIDDSAPKLLSPQTLPGSFPADRLVVPRQVIFDGADGMRIHGQLFLPPDRVRGKRYPAVLYFHGGSRRQMLLGWHYSGYYTRAYAMNQYMAAKGYIVLSVNYRSGIGYGMAFREALNYGAAGASEFNDVLGAGLYLRSRDDVDGDRIGLWGGSYGGYLTALGLARASELFAAGVDIHGVHDWNEGIRIFRPAYDPLDWPEMAKRAFEASPVASLDTWRSPVLLIHGDDDRNVFFSQSVRLAESLRKRKVHVEALVFPDEVHGFLLHGSWMQAFAATADFFDRMLKRKRR